MSVKLIFHGASYKTRGGSRRSARDGKANPRSGTSWQLNEACAFGDWFSHRATERPIHLFDSFPFSEWERTDPRNFVSQTPLVVRPLQPAAGTKQSSAWPCV